MRYLICIENDAKESESNGFTHTRNLLWCIMDDSYSQMDLSIQKDEIKIKQCLKNKIKNVY